MRKGKSLILTVLLFCLLICSVGFVACSKETKVNVIESDDGYTWKYTQPFVDEMDDDMKIDGKLEESRWSDDGKKWLTHVEKDVQMRYTTSFSEKGLYIAAEAKDSRMQWNDTRAFMNNSSFFFYIISNKATEYHAFDCMGFYVDELNSACRQGSRFAAKGLRTVDSNGVPTLTAEFFASWKSLNYTVAPDTGMPESVKFVPAYRYVESVDSNENAFLKPALAELGGNRVNNAYVFNTNGYINVDAEGAELGNGANGFAKSDGWDLSAVTDAKNKIVTSTTEGDQAIFFKNINSTRYSYSVTITYKESIATGFPAVGVLDMKNAADFNIMRFHGGDITGAGTNYRYFQLDFHSGRSDIQKGSYAVANSDTKTLQVRVIKDDTRYYYIIGETYAYAVDLNWLGGKTVPGLYTFDAKAEFSDWEATDYEGTDKDEAFEELCAKYIKPVKISSSISGGTVTTDKLAVAASSSESVQLSVLPARGYVITDLTVNGESIYDEFVREMNNGVATIVPTEASVINAVFSPMPAGSALRIVGSVKRGSGAANIGLRYAVSEQSGTNKMLYNSGNTTTAGMFDITVLRKGKYTIGGKTIETNGIYTLVFDGQFSHGESNIFTIDTSDDKFGGNYYSFGYIVLNPLKVKNMEETGEGTIRTTHTSYTGEIFSYYVTNDTVSGSFILDMKVTATNDKWPCYGFTIEDENNNSLQLFAAGSTTYRIMSSYDGVNYKQFDKGATYKNGESNLRLIYDENNDVFLFYVNDVLFDTLRRIDYLTGKTFRFGPVGYMSGADGSHNPVTDENPFATFTKPTITKEFTISAPEGATIVTSDGAEITNGRVPILSSVTVTIPKTAEQFYTIYVNDVPVATDNTDMVAKATLDISSDCNITYKQAYRVSGTVSAGNSYPELATSTDLGDVIVSVAGEDGSILYTANADVNGNFTLMLPEGEFYVGAVGSKLVSDSKKISVTGKNESISLTVDKPAVSDQLFNTTLRYDTKTGNYISDYVHGQKAGGFLSGSEVNAHDAYILSVELKDFGPEWPSGGFAIGTSAEKFVKFEIVKADDGTYILRIKDAVTNGESLWWFRSIEEFKQYNKLSEFTFTVVYSNSNYYIFLNDDLLVSVSENHVIGGTTIKSSIGSGNVMKFGLYGEAHIMFADWNYSLDESKIQKLIGRTITANGMIVTANGESVIDGKVLLGDKITVSIDVPQSRVYNILVDGKAVATENKDGKATATFTVTDNHTVTYAVAYEVSGNVTNGDENTVITIAAEGGNIVYTGKGTTFDTYLVNGKYILTAQNDVKVSAGAVIEVNDDSVQNVAVTLSRPKLNDALNGTWPLLPYDVTTGFYNVTDENSYNNGGYFADITAAGAFALKATINEFTGQWPSAGFAVQTANGFVRFSVRWRPEADWKCYDSLSWNPAGQNTDRGKLAVSPFVNGSAEIMLVYNGGSYYFYAGGKLIFSESGYDAPSGRVGLFCERNITYTDWSYTADYDEIYNVIGKTITARDMDVTVNGNHVTNDKVMLGDSVTVSVSVASGEKVSIMLDGVAVQTVIEDGKASATFTVTGDHTVTYDVVYAVSGTVIGGDESSVVVIVTETGVRVFEGNGASFVAYLPNGVYYISAKNDSKVSKGEQFTVDNAGVRDIELTINQPKINHYAFINQWGGWTWNMVDTYEDGKSVYHIPNHDYWAGIFYGGTFAKSADYVVKAKLNIALDNPNNGTVAGLALYGTTADDANNVKFEIVYDGGVYFLRVRGNNNGGFNKTFNSANTTWVKTNQDMLKHNADMAVVHRNGGYYVFINNILVLSLTGDDAVDIDNEVKTDRIQVGVYAEFEVVYADWGYSVDYDEIYALVGRTITADGMGIEVNGNPVTDGKVMLGDNVTVSLAVKEGESFSFLVDGKAIDTEIVGGLVTARFVVTGNHSVTYCVSYVVSGTTAPEATVVFVNNDGSEVKRVSADAYGKFSAILPDGVYYVSAETDRNVSDVGEITVNGAAVADCDIEVNRAKVTELLFDGNKNFTFDRTTGYYYNDASDPIWAGGFFCDVAVAQGNDFELSATMKDMVASPWPSAGLLIGTSKTAYVRFNLIRNSDAGIFGLQVRSAAAGETILWLDNTPFSNPFGGENGKLTIKLLYHGGWYSVYFNGTLVSRYDENVQLGDKGTLKAQLGDGDLKVGMYAERAVTYTAWDFKAENVEIPPEARLNGSFDSVAAFTYSAQDCAYKSVWENNNQRSVSDINVKNVTEWAWSADVCILSDWAYPSVGLALYDKNNAHDFIVKIIRLTPEDTSDNKDAQTCQLKIGATDFGADSEGNVTQQWVERNKTAMKNVTKMALVHNANGYYLFINGELVWSITGNEAAAITDGWGEVNLGIFAEQETSVKNLTYSTDIGSYAIN